MDERQMITARHGLLTIRMYAPSVEAATAFGEWLASRGYEVDIRDVMTTDAPRTPSEEQKANTLEQMYVRSLPR